MDEKFVELVLRFSACEQLESMFWENVMCFNNVCMADFFTGKMDDFALEFMLQHGARQQDKRCTEASCLDI